MATGDPFTAAVKQHGKTKRSSHRQLLIAAAGGVLLIVFLMRRKNATSTAAAVPAATDATALPPAAGSGQPATFADNGAQAASLGDAVTNSLSGLQTSLDSQTSAFQDLTSQLAGSPGNRLAGDTSGNQGGRINYGTPPAVTAPAADPPAAAPAPYVWDPAAAFAYVAAHPPNTPAGNTGSPAPLTAATTRAIASAGSDAGRILAHTKPHKPAAKKRR